ncbi:hypothetical protein C8J57DRAFT_1523303 [Mycena rebaudengoi]|nr:hypothetical protein C8J57DRAFT_1523303 [Mycena rebaudengoi]
MSCFRRAHKLTARWTGFRPQSMQANGSVLAATFTTATSKSTSTGATRMNCAPAQISLPAQSPAAATVYPTARSASAPLGSLILTSRQPFTTTHALSGEHTVSVSSLEFQVYPALSTLHSRLETPDSGPTCQLLAGCEFLDESGFDSPPVYPKWDEEVMRLTGGVEAGGTATLKQSLNSIKLCGSIDIIGVVGSLVRSILVVNSSAKLAQKFLSVLGFKSMMEANVDATRPVVDKVFPFVEAKAAFTHMEAQGYVGKVVIKI